QPSPASSVPSPHAVNLAVTFLVPSMVSVQVSAVPNAAQSPPQPRKVSLASATAYKVTVEPSAKLALWLAQPGPQLMATGDDVTVPVPLPGPAPPALVSLTTLTASRVVATWSWSVLALLLVKLSTTPTGVTVAVLVSVAVPVPGAMLAFTVKVAVPLAGSVTVVLRSPEPLAAPQVPPFAPAHVHAAEAICAGSVSCTVAPVAVAGPLLVTVIV